MPKDPRTIVLEAGDTEAVVDILDTPEYLGAYIEVTVTNGTVHVRLKAFNKGGDSWESKEMDIELVANHPEGDSLEDD